jgi:predicted O-linked N-acetylglucosamine transferase (SPINDLY family)
MKKSAASPKANQAQQAQWAAHALAALQQGDHLRALEICEKAWLPHAPDHPDALSYAGIASYMLKRWSMAVTYQQKLLTLPHLSPSLRADTLINVALSLTALHHTDQAEKAYRDSLAIRAAQPKAWNNLGNLLVKRPDQLQQALACYEKALALKPDYVNAWTNLGFAREQAGDAAGAEQAYTRALDLDPGYLPALQNSAALLEKQRPMQALALYRRAIALQPDNIHTVGNAVALRRTLADWAEDAGPHVQDVLDLLQRPHQQTIAPLHMMAWPEIPAGMLQKVALAFAHARWGAELARPPLCTQAQPLDSRRLRIGYLSPDFRNHPVTHLVGGVIEAHDRDKVEVFLYAYGQPADDVYRTALRTASEHFVDVSLWGDAQIAHQIQGDGIDVLVDLTGYTTHARLGITALRPAAIIVSWIGYVGTLGEPRLADHIVCDEVLIPEALVGLYSEKPARIAPCFQPNARWEPIPTTSTRLAEGLPAEGVVFCSFNQTFKFTPQIWDVWCQILRSVPGSVLWIPKPSVPEAIVNLQAETARRGVEPTRLVMAERKPLALHRERIGLADLALDTTPYNSGTTASDMLRCGVPLLTCMGESMSSRMAGSLLHSLGLDELVTHDMQAYADKAVQLATDPVRRRAIKTHLLQTLPKSQVFDPVHTAREVENLFVRLHTQASNPPMERT